MQPYLRNSLSILLAFEAILAGCAHRPRLDPFAVPASEVAPAHVDQGEFSTIEAVAYTREFDPEDSLPMPPRADAVPQVEVLPPAEVSPQVEVLPPAATGAGTELLTWEEVMLSTYRSFPLLESALYSRDIALGNHLAAHGEFDLKLKGASENGPVGFYENYRHSVGFVQPLFSGSEIWGGYRIGRGSFEPWYLERQTNDGGEFKAGVSVPLLRNRTIDERRAELWVTALDQQLAEFDIQAQTIGFMQQASYAYWEWVAAGRDQAIASRILDLAASRTERIRRQVEEELIDPPELTDNLRLVADRRAKLADATRKLEQTAAKLSLYWRDEQGRPIVPSPNRLPTFPDPTPIDPRQVDSDIQVALASRPDLRFIDTLRQQLQVDLEQANNQLQPDVNAVLWGAQDIGRPESPKRNKSPFELEVGLYADVPLQRRKARGKITAIEAKLQQLNAKRRMTEDNIGVDVQMAYAAMTAKFIQVQQSREAVRLAEDLAERERRNFDNGAADLLTVTLREQFAVESAIKEIDALLEYQQARADYLAAMASLPTQ